MTQRSPGKTARLPSLSRRSWLAAGAAGSVAALAGPTLLAAPRQAKMAYGLVTYMWGADWTLPKLLQYCEQADVLGVELRTTHAHGVEPTLSGKQRVEVRKRFADSPVELVGLGSNERFDSPSKETLQKAIDATKRFVELSHDVGSSGVKVKPDRFHKDVPREKTIEQIGRSLDQLGEFAAGFGQQIRLEVHGQCAEIPTIAAIMEFAKNQNVALCWNSNAHDLKAPGLEANFARLRPRFGRTMHIRELEYPDYPFPKLIQLLLESDYTGWVMLEGTRFPKDHQARVAALAKQKKRFQQLVDLPR